MFLSKITAFQMSIVPLNIIYEYGIGGICLRFVIGFFSFLSCLIWIPLALRLNKSHLLYINIFCSYSSILYGKNNRNQESYHCQNAKKPYNTAFCRIIWLLSDSFYHIRFSLPQLQNYHSFTYSSNSSIPQSSQNKRLNCSFQVDKV